MAQQGVIDHNVDLDTRASRGGPASRLEAIVPLSITVVAGLLCYGLFLRRAVWLSVVGYSVSPAERVLGGEIPYRDFLYNYTPGTLWINALLMKALGTSLLSVNLGILAFKLATLVSLFWIARKLTNGWIALAPVGLTLAWLGHKYVYGVVPTQYSLVFVLAATSMMLGYDRRRHLRWLLLSGLAAGIVFVFKYNVGILLMGAGTAVLFIRDVVVGAPNSSWRQRLFVCVKHAAAYWVGFGIVMSALAAFMAYNHALGPMLSHFLHHAAEYSEARAVPLPGPRQLVAVALGVIIALFGGWLVILKTPRLFLAYLMAILILGCGLLLVPGRAYRIKLSVQAGVAYLPLILFAASAALVVWRLRSCLRDDEARREWWGQHGTLIVVGLFTIGAYLEMYPRADDYHLVRVLPLVFLLLTLFVVTTFRSVAGRFHKYLERPNGAALLCVATPFILLAAVGLEATWRPQFDSEFRFIDRNPLSIDRARGMLVSARQADLIEGMARAIEENSGPGDSMFSFAQRGSGFYFLSARRNPTRFVWWRSVGIDTHDREEVVRMIGAREVTLVLLQDTLTNKSIREVVESNYHKVAAVADIAVFRRNDS